MNRTNIAPRKIRKRIYENHMDLVESPAVTQIMTVWRRSAVPMAKGWSIRVNEIERAMVIEDVKSRREISENSLS